MYEEPSKSSPFLYFTYLKTTGFLHITFSPNKAAHNRSARESHVCQHLDPRLYALPQQNPTVLL